MVRAYCQTIISRASMDHADVKLKRVGASNVIIPAKIGGQRMAKLVAQPDIIEFADYMLLQSTESIPFPKQSCKTPTGSLLWVHTGKLKV